MNYKSYYQYDRPRFSVRTSDCHRNCTQLPRQPPSQTDTIYRNTPVPPLYYLWNEMNKFKADAFARKKLFVWSEKLYTFLFFFNLVASPITRKKSGRVWPFQRIHNVFPGVLGILSDTTLSDRERGQSYSENWMTYEISLCLTENFFISKRSCVCQKHSKELQWIGRNCQVSRYLSCRLLWISHSVCPASCNNILTHKKI